MPVACTHNVNAADSARGSNVSIKAIGDVANSYITIKGSDIKPAGTTTQDKLIESFAGSHDFIDGKLSGLYDEQENIKRWMSDTERAAYDIGVTIGVSCPSVRNSFIAEFQPLFFKDQPVGAVF